jgi:hypothetical protein
MVQVVDNIHCTHVHAYDTIHLKSSLDEATTIQSSGDCFTPLTNNDPDD